MKNILLALLLLISTSVFCQNIPYYGSYAAVDTTCAWNEDVVFVTTKGWTAYQTIEDTYNGTIDSSICITLKIDETYGGISFVFDEIDTTRSLYIKADLNEGNKIALDSNSIYQAYEGFFDPFDFIKTGIDCNDLICSGIILGIEIPDSNMTDITKRFQFFNKSTFDGGFCFATEKFEIQYLTDYIIKLTFQNISVDTLKRWANPFTEMSYNITNITDLTNATGYYDGSDYNISGYDIIDYTTGLLTYNDPFYPSPDHVDYIDVTPNPNPSVVTNINININSYNTLLMQPYVQLRGGFVEGDTLRHTVNLVNNGGTFCLSIAEMVFNGNTNYIFNSGKIEMYSPLACIMFKNGAALKVSDNAHFDYGIKGVGVLGFRSGGTLEIGNNASMQINNRVSLISEPNSELTGDIYMNLNSGSTLIFGDGASITNDAKSASGAHLCIYMNGGILNTDALSAESRQLIRLIYPNASADKNEEIQIFPNPVTQTFTAEIQSIENKTGVIQITNMLGVVLMQKNVVLTPGLNAIKMDISSLNNQVYLVNLICNNDFRVKAIVKQ